MKVLDEAIKENDKDIDTWLQLGKALIAADSLKAAEIKITKAKAMDESNPETYIVLGDLYFAKRVYPLACSNYEEALKKDENNVQARINLAISYGKMANVEMDDDLRNELFKKSLVEWNTVTKQDPKNAKAFFEQGRIFYYAKQYKESAASLLKFVELRPSGSLGRWMLAQSLYEIGACDSARTHLEISAEQIDSVKTKAKLLLARCFYDKKEYAQSFEAYTVVAANSEMEMKDVRSFGTAALFAGDTTKAIELWNKAIDMDPEGNCQLMFLVGTQLNKMKMYGDAVTVLKRRLATASCTDRLSETNFTIGTAIFFDASQDTIVANRAQTALPYMLKAVEQDTNNLWASIYLGDVYAALDSMPKAKEAFRFAIDVAAADTSSAQNKSVMQQAFFKMTNMALEAKNWAEVTKVAKEWSDMSPDSEYAFLFLAFGNQGLQNTDAACIAYRKVLRINPKNTTASKNLNALQCK
jgi:tetratricopeptide (TPR) repeat protein